MSDTEKLKQALSTIYGDTRISRQIEYVLCDIAHLCDKEGINLEQALSRAMDLYREEK